MCLQRRSAVPWCHVRRVAKRQKPNRAEDMPATRTATWRGNSGVRGAGELNLALAIIEAEGPMAFVCELAEG
jgi:hypothetical protein